MSRHRRAATAMTTTLLGAGLACAPGAPPGRPTPDRMLAHFDLALELRGYAVLGELDGFRETARELAELEFVGEAPTGPLAPLAPMRALAHAGADADSPEVAAATAAALAGTCGDCHVASGVGLGDRFTVGGPPPSGGTRRHMGALAWASRLLWDGLVGPSERTWARGAEALAGAGPFPESLDAGLPPTDVEAKGERLRSLGREAAAATVVSDRVRVLGDVWATCASCHRAAGVGRR